MKIEADRICLSGLIFKASSFTYKSPRQQISKCEMFKKRGQTTGMTTVNHSRRSRLESTPASSSRDSIVSDQSWYHVVVCRRATIVAQSESQPDIIAFGYHQCQSRPYVPGSHLSNANIRSMKCIPQADSSAKFTLSGCFHVFYLFPVFPDLILHHFQPGVHLPQIVKFLFIPVHDLFLR